jgi:very-short-patch-repair endonuclease
VPTHFAKRFFDGEMLMSNKKPFYRDSADIWSKNFEKLPDRCKELFFQFFHPYSPLYEFNNNIFKLTMRTELDYEECKSPIETIFNFAFDIYHYCILDNHAVYDMSRQEPIEIDGKTYIVDFLIEQDSVEDIDYKLVVECDGYEYHSTKEQIQKDNDRDIALKTAGYDVVRFTGSQIFNTPMQCAAKVLNLLETMAKVYRKRS